MRFRKTLDQNIRCAAAAGRFYPDDPEELQVLVGKLLAQAEDTQSSIPKALVVPHAGFIYSGPIAASAYALLKPASKVIRNVVMIGPAHFVAVPGLALPAAREFETPLGKVRVSEAMEKIARRFPFVMTSAAAHEPEHSLEVQLPFLQLILPEFEILPLLAGTLEPSQIAEVLDALWGGPETLILISSDLSHFLTWSAARKFDQATADAIEHLAPEQISEIQACGRLPIKGFLQCARGHGLAGHTLDLRNSGDTAGSRDRVVGYGAFAFA